MIDLAAIPVHGSRIAAYVMDQAATLNHEFRIAAYVATWVIQLGYLAWLGLKWRSIKRDAKR